MHKKLNLTVEEVLNKDFSIQYKGYVPEEVDSFLDKVIADFKSIEEIRDYYETQNKALQKTNAVLKNKVDELETELELENTKKKGQPAGDAGNSNNLELIKKVATLENDLFQARKELEELKSNK